MLIKKLKIKTANLARQMHFYAEILGFKILEKRDDEIYFQIGKSILVLKMSESFTPYHFCINIPANKEFEALRWLKERVEIIKNDELEIQSFESWNASAIYFYDADNNIVEFIARKTLKNGTTEAFNVRQAIQISEIGVPVNDILSSTQALQRIVTLSKYSGNFERFCAIGNEEGLFIFINSKLKTWFPTDDRAYASDFEIKFVHVGQTYDLAFQNGMILKK